MDAQENISDMGAKGRYGCGSRHRETTVETISRLKEAIKSGMVEAEAATE